MILLNLRNTSYRILKYIHQNWLLQLICLMIIRHILKAMQPALDHHYGGNSHHPEYYENGISDMSLFDLAEMLMDWKAAVERHNDGDILKSLEINIKRFNISPDLAKILSKTIKMSMPYYVSYKKD